MFCERGEGSLHEKRVGARIGSRGVVAARNSILLRLRALDISDISTRGGTTARRWWRRAKLSACLAGGSAVIWLFGRVPLVMKKSQNTKSRRGYKVWVGFVTAPSGRWEFGWEVRPTTLLCSLQSRLFRVGNWVKKDGNSRSPLLLFQPSSEERVSNPASNPHWQNVGLRGFNDSKFRIRGTRQSVCLLRWPNNCSE